MKTKIYIAADHGGFELKTSLKEAFPNIDWVDLGTHNGDSVDYPAYAANLCQELKKSFSSEELLKACGVLICGSGVGISIQANRFPWIRAALVSNVEVAKLSRQHNASNVLCLGGRFTSATEAKGIFKAWIDAEFEGGRHERRVNMLSKTI